jgi:hypothetical protein
VIFSSPVPSLHSAVIGFAPSEGVTEEVLSDLAFQGAPFFLTGGGDSRLDESATKTE